MIINSITRGINLPQQPTFKSNSVSNEQASRSTNVLTDTLFALAFMGATLVPTACSRDDINEFNPKENQIELFANDAICEDCLDEQNGINEKANFIFHQLGIIDEDKRISDIAELSFTDGNGERYVFNVVGECEYGPEFAGTVVGDDGLKKHAKLKLFQGNELIENQVGISTWHSRNHGSAYIKQVGWNYVDGRYQAVLHEFRPAVNSSERGKYGEYIYNKDNEFELIRTPDGLISKAIGKNPGTPTEIFTNLSVKYKTGEETDEPFVSLVNPNDISAYSTHYGASE